MGIAQGVTFVFHHLRKDIPPSHQDHHAGGPGDRRVEQIAGAEHGGTAGDGQDHDRILTALALVYRYRIGVLQLIQLRELVDRLPPVEIHHQRLGYGMSPLKIPLPSTPFFFHSKE